MHFTAQHEIFCTSFIAASYLRNVLDFKRKVYLFGTPGFARELDLVGIPYTGTGVYYYSTLHTTHIYYNNRGALHSKILCYQQADPMPEEYSVPELMKTELDPEVHIHTHTHTHTCS